MEKGEEQIWGYKGRKAAEKKEKEKGRGCMIYIKRLKGKAIGC